MRPGTPYFVSVMHLAGLSNDPLGELNSSITDIINFQETVRLSKLAKSVGVSRFIFSSSCSTYGVNADTVNEESPLEPLTAYAKSKVESEKSLLSLQDNNFAPVILRSATAYGISPSMRLDLVVNNLTASAFVTGLVKLLSDGTAWRPIIHVKDMARAFVTTLKADFSDVKGEIFNVGSNNENFIVREIANMVEKRVPNSRIVYQENASKDKRSYKVDFSKITERIGFKTKENLSEGIKDLYSTFKEKNLSKIDFEDRKFYRVKQLKWLIENKKIDTNLYNS